ncbi:MFS transporter [Amycolatopsis cynarae]|uniref:MFS transporter n=1 Tax=Amycolatopsis cynarae TaxID=2995223 RepID=A0ABY7B8G8_9PSEU|nr:MFS transporter [Amycolatopsis sp. HUAS 11-8]WAL68635.1 MFS transporter [Amycolatopsis sp. HUAS 11-8]
MSGPTDRAAVIATFRDSPPAVKTLLAGVFINRLSGFLNIFLVLFLTSTGYGEEQAALAVGVYGVGGVVGVLAGGFLAARIGARAATVISMSSAGALMASLLYLPSYGLILVVVALASVAAQFYRPASAALLSDLVPEGRQVMIFAMYRFCLNVGATVAPLLGLGLYHLAGERYGLVFWCEALVAVAYAVLAGFTLPAHRGTRATGVVTRGGYREMMRDRHYLLYLVAMFCQGAVYVQYLSTLPLDVQASGIPVFWYTLAVSVNGLMVIAFELLVTKRTQAWPIRLTLGLGLGLIGVGVAAYGLPALPAVIVGATLVWSLGEIIGGPATFAYPGLRAPASLKTQYIGAFQLMLGTGTAAGPVLGGWLFLRFGHSVWPVLAIGSVLAVSLTLAATRGARTEPDSSVAVVADSPAPGA